jgi:hypothetical protein
MSVYVNIRMYVCVLRVTPLLLQAECAPPLLPTAVHSPRSTIGGMEGTRLGCGGRS